MTGINEEKTKEILLKENYVTEDDFKKAENYARARHTSAIDYLISEELTSKDIIGQAIAEFLGVPYCDLNSNRPTREMVMKIPENVAKKHRIVIFAEDEKNVNISTDNPKENSEDKELKVILDEILKKKISFSYSLREDIESAFIHYIKPLDVRFMEIIKRNGSVAPEILEEIFEDALAFRASDIHLEPSEKDVVARFRIDGMLHEVGKIPKDFYENILNRIKIKSNLRIDEHFATQDGAIRYSKNDKMTDFRISIVPTLNGENVAIRVLSEYVRNLTMSDLGLSIPNQKILENASKKPFGMILVTGPTGSGKTSTLYAVLKTLNNPEVNITTIEDPVEYKIEGVNQIQVNLKTNLTFASGLKSIVRQDPNIILVGEIRDKETVEIAVNAALTGHLLLSTFHANDASTAIPRLLDMGAEPFLLSSTLELIVAQRLVRRICDSCRYSYKSLPEEFDNIMTGLSKYFPKEIILYKSKGCKDCGFTGFRGRIGIFEFIQTNREMKELILKNPSTQEIWDLAKKNGSLSLFEDGLEKVKNGVTTIEELLRVASPWK